MIRRQTIFEARWILGALVVLTAIFALVNLRGFAGVCVLLILYTFYFFRDPEREIPGEENSVVAAADGVVVEIEDLVESEVTQQTMKRVAIFLSVFDVHVNRAPISGVITYSERKVGKFLDARHKDASRLNECRTWAIRNEDKNVTVVVRQITGAIARRIVAWAQVGQKIERGERFGMIRFGSRTEIYLPIESEVIVKVGDRVQGGMSVIGRLPNAADATV